MHGHRNPSSRPSMLIAVVAVGLILAACGANTGSSAAASGGTVVKIVGLAYDPTSLTVNAGTMVTFQNNDTVDHTLTNGKDGKPDANPLFDRALPVGKSETVTFSKAGTFNVTGPSSVGTLMVDPSVASGNVTGTLRVRSRTAWPIVTPSWCA